MRSCLQFRRDRGVCVCQERWEAILCLFLDNCLRQNWTTRIKLKCNKLTWKLKKFEYHLKCSLCRFFALLTWCKHLHERVGQSTLKSRWIYICLFIFLSLCQCPALKSHSLSLIPTQIMTNAPACLPSGFASLITQCPLSSHPSGIGWPLQWRQSPSVPACRLLCRSSAVSQSMTM